MTRYGMAIDKTKCIGCKTCLMACKISNNLPRDVWFNRYVTEDAEAEFAAVGTYPNLKMVSYTVACQHCKNPACVAVCPTGASIQDDDGIVRVLEDKCIGCKSCIQACPYDVRTLIEKPEYYVDDVQLGRHTEVPLHRRRGGEVHVLQGPHRPGQEPRLHGPVPGPRPLLGRFGRPELLTCRG